MSLSCILLWLLLPLLIIVGTLAWLTESNHDRAIRWRAAGLSQQRIADRLGCSRYRVRRLLAG